MSDDAKIPLPSDAPPSLRAHLAAPRHKTFAVLGLGHSGQAMAAALLDRGAHVIGLDDAPDCAARPCVQALAARGMAVVAAPAALPACAALLISPGVHPHHPLVQQALRRDLPVCGELELCGDFLAPVVAITGTNGKSTTTALTGALLAGLGKRVFAGGNLGAPVITQVARGTPVDVLVLELSSYQLETAYGLRPQVAVVLNVTPDHLERYASFAAYADAKARLIRAVPEDGHVIVNADCPTTVEMAAQARGRVWWLSRHARLPGAGAWVRGDTLVPCDLGQCPSVDLAHDKLHGAHNRLNAAAAILAVWALDEGADAAALQRAYRGFAGLPHRLQDVGEIDGVRYVNDSKATNDASTAIAVRAMTQPLVLLLGGKDKGGGYAETLGALKEAAQVRGVIAFGAARRVIEAACAEAGQTVLGASDLQAALSLARRQATRGDVVLLSPACASFDAFANYEARGAAFAAWVQAGGH